MSSIPDQIEQCKKEIAEFKAQIEAHRGDPEVDQPRTSTGISGAVQRSAAGRSPPLEMRFVCCAAMAFFIARSFLFSADCNLSV